MYRSHPASRFILLFTTLFLAAAVLPAEDDINYNDRIVEVLEGYQTLMSTDLDDDVEDLPGEAWFIVSQAINEGFLRFTVDPVTNSLIRGARFNVSPNSKVTHVILTHKLLDAWGTSPSLTYTVITHAVREAANFFMDPYAWGSAQGDVMNKFFMRLDGYGAEAELIRDRLVPSGYLITPYESYVLDSFETDGLISLAMFLERMSLPVAQGLNEVRVAFENDGNDEALRTVLVELGTTLLDARNGLPLSSEDAEVYPIAVAIHTWLEFTPEMIARIHNKERRTNPLNFDQILARESEYAELRRRLEASRIKDLPLINYMYSQNTEGFESMM